MVVQCLECRTTQQQPQMKSRLALLHPCSNLVILLTTVLNSYTIKTIINIGKSQFETFMKERVIERKVSLFKPIKASKLSSSERKTALMQKVSTLKQNCSLFSQLYISCQVRVGNLDNFLSHESQNYLPSISKQGKLRFGQKSTLLEPLKSNLSDQDAVFSPNVEAKINDGATLVNMLKHTLRTTF